MRLLDRLQSVLNATARLVYGLQKYDHVTPPVHDLHWLHVPERIAFQNAVLVYCCQHGIAPHYFANELHCVADDELRPRLHSAATTEFVVPNTVHF